MGASKKNWPLGLGFDRFLWFYWWRNQSMVPALAEDNHYIQQPYLPEQGYHLSKDLADKAIEYIP
jgi:arylsulfatase